MVKPRYLLVACLAGLFLSGCATTPYKMRKLELGMTPDQVRKAAGDPYTVRAAKEYEDGHADMVWEYVTWFAINAKDYWVFFSNGKVVQWGEPGDFSTLTTLEDKIPVKEYVPIRQER